MKKTIGLLALTLSTSACLSLEERGLPEAVEVTVSRQQQSAPAAPPPSVSIDPGAMLGLSSVAAQTFNLGETRELAVRIAAATQFDGNVDFTIERDELNLVDTSNDVVISVSPNRVRLVPGGVADLKIIVQVKTSSRSMTGQHFHLVAKEDRPVAPALKVIDVDLAVQAVFEVKVHGGNAPEVWSNDGGALSFRPHTGGVLVRFINHDTAKTHTVHSSGAIPHQGTTTPMAAATAAGLGGKYEHLVPMGAASGADVWCHSHESTALKRRLNFNAAL